MQEPTFEIEVEIEVPLPEVHDFLLDLDNYVELHPLIESIELLSPLDEMPTARHYRVVDRIPFGPFNMKTVYRAALEPVSDSEVHGHAWQSPGIRLHTIYALSSFDRGTRLIERCRVESPRLLKGFVIRQGRAAHEETLRKMKQILEARARAGSPGEGAAG